MYIAALRIADDFGLDAVGIQYQQGLKDLVPASDLAEGLLNNVERPPVTSRDGSRVLYAGAPLPHFNEADEGVAVDALVTNRVWTAMGLDPATTLHDVRWGEDYDGRFVWVYEISGSVPPSHLPAATPAPRAGARARCTSRPAAAPIKGVSKPGEIVWSRLFIADGTLHLDIGRATVVELPAEETAAALGRDQPGVADHARRAARRDPRPVHGPAQGQPRPGRLRPGRRDRRPGAGGQGGDVRPRSG